MRYKILEHTGDLKIKVFGNTKKELFVNAALFLIEYLKPTPSAGISKKIIKREISVSSFDLETLLVDFLTEVLYHIQKYKEVYSRINIKEFIDTPKKEKRIKAEIEGYRFLHLEEDIKGVTYYGLKIKKNKLWSATILFDI